MGPTGAIVDPSNSYNQARLDSDHGSLVSISISPGVLDSSWNLSSLWQDPHDSASDYSVGVTNIETWKVTRQVDIHLRYCIACLYQSESAFVNNHVESCSAPAMANGNTLYSALAPTPYPIRAAQSHPRR